MIEDKAMYERRAADADARGNKREAKLHRVAVAQFDKAIKEEMSK